MNTGPKYKRVVYQSDYIDGHEGTNTMQDAFAMAIESNVNVFILSFAVPEDGTNILIPQEWSAMDLWMKLGPSVRTTLLNNARDAGMYVIFAIGGAGGVGSWNGTTWASLITTNIRLYAEQIFTMIEDSGLMGVDLDYEHMSRSGVYDESMEFIANSIIELGKIYKEKGVFGEYLITAAPEMAYFSDAFVRGQAGSTRGRTYQWIEMESGAGEYMSFYSIQYYNTNDGDLKAYDKLFIYNSEYPAAVQQLISEGFPQEKLVVGKMNYGTEGSHTELDYVNIIPNLRDYFIKAYNDYDHLTTSEHYSPGSMIWQWIDKIKYRANPEYLEQTMEMFKTLKDVMEDGEPGPINPGPINPGDPATCENDLIICYSDLSIETGRANACVSNLSTETNRANACVSDLSTETGRANACVSNLSTETNRADVCDSDLSTETGRANACVSDLARCEAALSGDCLACYAQVASDAKIIEDLEEDLSICQTELYDCGDCGDCDDKVNSWYRIGFFICMALIIILFIMLIYYMYKYNKKE